MKTKRTTGVTAQDIKDWRAYERVRASGRFNMFDPRAVRATGLSKVRYGFVLANYLKLRDAALKDIPTRPLQPSPVCTQEDIIMAEELSRDRNPGAA